MSESISREQVLAKVRRSFKELFSLNEAKLTESARLVEDLGLDSIDALDLAAHIEEITPERVPQEELRKLRTLGDVVDLLHRLVNVPGANVQLDPPTPAEQPS